MPRTFARAISASGLTYAHDGSELFDQEFEIADGVEVAAGLINLPHVNERLPCILTLRARSVVQSLG